MVLATGAIHHHQMQMRSRTDSDQQNDLLSPKDVQEQASPSSSPRWRSGSSSSPKVKDGDHHHHHHQDGDCGTASKTSGASQTSEPEGYGTEGYASSKPQSRQSLSIAPSWSIRDVARRMSELSHEKRNFKFIRSHSRILGDINDLPWSRKICIYLVENYAVEMLLGFLILFNMLLLILETDATVDDGVAPLWIVVLNYMLIIIYASEVSGKLWAYREKFFKSGWNIMDFAVSSSDVLLIFLEAAVGDMPKVSVLRVFRLLRLMRAFKALSMFPELAMLLRSFMCAIKAIFWGILLIMIVITIWSILAVQVIHPLNKEVARRGVYSGCDRCERAFGSVFQSNLTIFQTIVAGDSWGQVALPIIEDYPLAGVFFLLVLVTIGIAIMNLILAVIVDRAQGQKQASIDEVLHEKEREFAEAAHHLIQLCAKLDTDESGYLSKEELLAGYETEEFARNMQVMSLEREDMSAIFDVLDDDGSGDVSYKELVNQLFRFRSPDLRTAIFELTRLHQKVQHMLKNHIEVNHQDVIKNHEVVMGMLGDTRARVHSIAEVAIASSESSKSSPAVPQTPKAQSDDLAVAVASFDQNGVPKAPPITLEMVEQRLHEDLRQLNHELKAEMRHLSQTSEVNTESLASVRALVENLDIPSKWENYVSSARFGTSPLPSGRGLTSAQSSGGLLQHVRDVRVTETLLREGHSDTSISNLLSEPSILGTRGRANSRAVPHENAPPVLDAFSCGILPSRDSCCKSTLEAVSKVVPPVRGMPSPGDDGTEIGSSR